MQKSGKKTKLKYPLLFIEWNDAYSPADNNWHTMEQIEEWYGQIGVHHDVGFKIKEDDNYLTLACYGLENGKPVHFHRELAIPQNFIIRRISLTKFVNQKLK